MFLLFLILELLIFSYFSDQYGFLRTLAYYLAPSFLGLFFIFVGGQRAFLKFQMSLMSGEKIEKTVLKAARFFIFGFLFTMPFFLTRAFALVMFLPGIQHLLIVYLTKKMAGKVFTSYRRPSYGDQEAHGWSSRQTYDGRYRIRDIDASVIDVKPIEITKKEINDI